MAPAEFIVFRTAVPGSAASIEAGVRWLGSVRPVDHQGILFVATAEALRQPTHLHDMLGQATVRRLLDEGEGEVRGRPVRLLTEHGLGRQRTGLACEGPILAMWPTLLQLRALRKMRRSPLGVVVWNYDRDVAPLFDEVDEVSEASNEVRNARRSES